MNFNRVFHYFHHPFWGVLHLPIFGSTPHVVQLRIHLQLLVLHGFLRGKVSNFAAQQPDTDWTRHKKPKIFKRQTANRDHNSKIKLGSIRKPISSSESLPVASTVPSCCVCERCLVESHLHTVLRSTGHQEALHFMRLPVLVFVFVFKEPIIFRSLEHHSLISQHVSRNL